MCRSKLADSALGAIVTHAVVTSDGNFILAAESGNVMYWSVDEKIVVFKEEQKDMLQVMDRCTKGKVHFQDNPDSPCRFFCTTTNVRVLWCPRFLI